MVLSVPISNFFKPVVQPHIQYSISKNIFGIFIIIYDQKNKYSKLVSSRIWNKRLP